MGCYPQFKNVDGGGQITFFFLSRPRLNLYTGGQIQLLLGVPLTAAMTDKTLEYQVLPASIGYA